MLQTQLLADRLEAGVDEAGRGCLAGPVFAAAVILPKGFKNEIINDSKKLNEKQRAYLREVIEREALYYAVASVSPKEIDEINILNASIMAMHLALEQLTTQPKHIAVDGNRFKPYKNVTHQCVVKGDQKFMNIAAASILAKTYRDEYMLKLHKTFPFYQWNTNKGYPTKKHRLAIAEKGSCIHHRKSFKLKNK